MWDEEEICAENYHLSFYIITLGAFVIVDHSGMEDEVHNQPKKYDLDHNESPSSSLVRATEGHGLLTCRELRVDFWPTLMRN